MAPDERFCGLIGNHGGNTMQKPGDVTSLVEEYRILLVDTQCVPSESQERILSCEADWSPQAASDLLRLARKYGSFMLRNALAISVALEIKDGELGY
jgi:hypothetical protein